MIFGYFGECTCQLWKLGSSNFRQDMNYCTDTTWSSCHTSQAPLKSRDQGRRHALQNISKSVTYVFCMFFSQNFLGRLRMLKIRAQREEIWKMSLVPPNFEELPNPSDSHMSHSAKSWSYQYSNGSYLNPDNPSFHNQWRPRPNYLNFMYQCIKIIFNHFPYIIQRLQYIINEGKWGKCPPS